MSDLHGLTTIIEGTESNGHWSIMDREPLLAGLPSQGEVAQLGALVWQFGIFSFASSLCTHNSNWAYQIVLPLFGETLSRLLLLSYQIKGIVVGRRKGFQVVPSIVYLAEYGS